MKESVPCRTCFIDAPDVAESYVEDEYGVAGDVAAVTRAVSQFAGDVDFPAVAFVLPVWQTVVAFVHGLQSGGKTIS